ncbi:MAG TPA: GlsB/YeaQ/YmgE family stress response membrane protein [Ktedonobacterales bacterium]|nr:GlsB/YeaQ/YmgE family stress response membrane protein [Ktedonobacterales bacterium]
MHVMVLAAIDSTLGWFAWIIVGGLAGMVAGMLMRGGGFGIIGDIVVGIIGAVIGVFLLGLLINGTVGWIGSFLVALFGACLLVAVLRAFTWNRTRAL